MGVDYEHELGNGWSPAINILLQGMKEIRDDQKSIHAEVTTIATTQALMKQSIDGFQDLPGRIKKLEDTELKQDTLRSQNRWLLGIGLTILGSIALPAMGLILSSWGLF